MKAIRDAAQALLDQFDAEAKNGGAAISAHAFRRLEILRAALAAPAQSPDERIAEHMRLVAKVAGRSYERAYVALAETTAAVESSARALLGAAQEDAEHAAMYRWLREHGEPDAGMAYRPDWSPDMYDVAIRAAMKEQKV